jgi:hypothetical protein
MVDSSFPRSQYEQELDISEIGLDSAKAFLANIADFFLQATCVRKSLKAGVLETSRAMAVKRLSSWLT